jgi:hypothetical protein
MRRKATGEAESHKALAPADDLLARAENAVRKLLLREKEVPAEFGLTVGWLRKTRGLIRKGELDAGPRFIESGRMIYYRRSAIEQWLDEHEKGRASAQA